jgi:hypothetical protein
METWAEDSDCADDCVDDEDGCVLLECFARA